MTNPTDTIGQIDTLRAQLAGMNRGDSGWNKVSASIKSSVAVLVRQSYVEAKVYEAEMGDHFIADEDHGEAVDQLRGRLSRVGLHPSTVSDACRELGDLLGVDC